MKILSQFGSQFSFIAVQYVSKEQSDVTPEKATAENFRYGLYMNFDSTIKLSLTKNLPFPQSFNEPLYFV